MYNQSCYCRSRCPLCGREFPVPERGYRDLPDSVFVEKLLAMKAIDVENESATKRSCDVCSGQDSSTMPRLLYYYFFYFPRSINPVG